MDCSPAEIRGTSGLAGQLTVTSSLASLERPGEGHHDTASSTSNTTLEAHVIKARCDEGSSQKWEAVTTKRCLANLIDCNEKLLVDQAFQWSWSQAAHQILRDREVHVGRVSRLSRSRSASLFGNKNADKWLEQSSPAVLLEFAGGVGTFPYDEHEDPKNQRVDTVQAHSLWATLEDRSFCLSPELDT